MRSSDPGELNRRILYFYLFRILLSFQIWAPFWFLWLFSNLITPDGRHDTLRATLVDAAFWAVNFLTAIPAGLMADRFGRKRALGVGVSLWSVGVFLAGLSRTFEALVIANAIWAVGASFTLGIDSAYLYDTLLEADRAAEYPRTVARATLLGFASLALGAFVGGSLAGQGLGFDVLLIGSGALGLPLLWVLSRFVEPRVPRRVEPGLLLQLRGGLATVRRRLDVRLIIAFYVLIFFVTYLASFFRQDFVGGLLKGNWFPYGLVFAGFFLIAALAGLATQLTLQRLGELGSLVLLTLLIFPSMAMMYVVLLPAFPGGFRLATGIGTQATFYVISGMGSPIVSTLLNRRVASHERALIFGIMTFVETLALSIFEPVVGLLTLRYDIAPGLVLLDLVALPPILYILLAFRRSSRRMPTPVAVPLALEGPTLK